MIIMSTGVLTKHRYLVAVSGGPDSMALLDMMKEKYELIVAHVNYHHRDTASRDERIVRNYCKKNNIKFCLKNFKETKGNFQDQARVFRYKFFEELINKYELDGVLVAHHKDDLIETYLLQKKRNSGVSYYGLKKNTNIFNIKVIRPLLSYTKNDLVNYCEINNIKYGIDESNLTNDYSRNKIRHSVVEKMSLKEKNNLIKEIKELNNKQLKEIKECKKFINKKTRFNYEKFISFKYLERLIRELLSHDLSDAYVKELINQLKKTKTLELLIKNKYIVKEYGYIEVFDKPKDYKFIIKKIEYKKYDHFKLCRKGTSFEGVTLTKSDFPLTIRNYRSGDKIEMLYGTKKINRWFIDNKISSIDRKTWPIMINAKGSAILVPNIGCDKSHYSTKHNLFMVKLNNTGGLNNDA